MSQISHGAVFALRRQYAVVVYVHAAGAEDILEGNLKLILGLIWHLVLRYQISRSKMPAKKLMLAWINAVLPGYTVSNFTSDWNDGLALQ